MRKLESIQEFYENRYKWIPNEIRNGLGHFNVFPLEYPAIGEGAQPLEYGRREWYNIVLVFDGGILQCAGEEYAVRKHAVVFTDPFTPFGWKERNKITRGYFCIFNDPFLNKDRRIVNYAPFLKTTSPFYELTQEGAEAVEKHFLRMIREVKSEYLYKYDIARLLVEEILHVTMKSLNFEQISPKAQTASERIVIHFLELLERQFPIESPTQSLSFATASDFAQQLNIHVNHLNKSVKQVTEKNTTQIIKERLIQEAKTLIKLTDWNISEIAFSLGFKETTHFNNFFKRITNQTPTQFRND